MKPSPKKVVKDYGIFTPRGALCGGFPYHVYYSKRHAAYQANVFTHSSTTKRIIQQVEIHIPQPKKKNK